MLSYEEILKIDDYDNGEDILFERAQKEYVKLYREMIEHEKKNQTMEKRYLTDTKFKNNHSENDILMFNNEKVSEIFIKTYIRLKKKNREENVIITRDNFLFGKLMNKYITDSLYLSDMRISELEKSTNKFLDKKKWNLGEGEKLFSQYSGDSESPMFSSTYSKSNIPVRAVRICNNCGEIYPLDKCSHCASEEWVPGKIKDGNVGIFCHKCNRGFTSWTCKKCDSKNPINQSLAVDSGNCFIATAVYNSYDAPEVIILRKFRDNILSLSNYGKLLVKFYYFISPPIAKFLSKKSKLKVIVREKILTPFVRYLEHKLNK
jgi:hypothetical protein